MINSILNVIKKHDMLTFLVLVFAFNWLGGAPAFAYNVGLIQNPPSPALSSIGTLMRLVGMPLGCAAFVTAITRGRTGLREWFAPTFRPRAGWQWYLVVLLTYPVTALIAIVLSGANLAEMFNARVEWVASQLGLSDANLWLMIPVTILISFMTVFLEEPGWRGFVLPRLQAKHSALYSGLLLGIVWAVWHTLNFFDKGSAQYGIPYLGFVLETVAISILAVWVYNNSNSSVWMTMLLHSTLVLGGFYLPAGIPGVTGNYVAFWASVAVLVTLAALVVLFYGPQQLKGHTKREEVYLWTKS